MQGFGDVVVARTAQECDREVAQAGHDGGRGAGADLGADLVECDVADLVVLVFTGPVTL